MALIQIQLTAAQAEELKAGLEDTELSTYADMIQTAQDAEKVAEAKRAEAKRNSRARTSTNRKARLAELREKAAELDRIKANSTLG